MAEQLFRKAALARLASPEQLDRTVSVTNPRLWIALCTLTVIAAVTVVWALVGEVRTRVSASGILLIRGGQVFGALSPVSGRLGKLDAGVGDRVERGQVLATIVQPETIERLRGAEESLNERKRIHEELRMAIDKEDAINRQNVRRSRERLQNIVSLARSKVATTRQRMQDHEKLAEEGIVARVNVESSTQDYNQARQELLEALNRLDDIESRELTRRNEAATRLNESLDRVGQAERKLGEIRATLATAQVTAPIAGRVTEIMEHVGSIVRSSTAIVSIESEGGEGIEVLAYIPPDIGKRVRDRHGRACLPGHSQARRCRRG